MSNNNPLFEKEITFTSTCQICGRANMGCRNHHLVPKRLLRRLQPSRVKRWEHLKVVICNDCNDEFHMENKLLKRIAVLEQRVKELAREKESLSRENQELKK